MDGSTCITYTLYGFTLPSIWHVWLLLPESDSEKAFIAPVFLDLKKTQTFSSTEERRHTESQSDTDVI